MRRETSRVSLLVCPFCVRGQLLRPTTVVFIRLDRRSAAGSGRPRPTGHRRDLLTSEVRDELKQLRKENTEPQTGERDLEGREPLISRRSSTRPGDGDSLRGGAAGSPPGHTDIYCGR